MFPVAAAKGMVSPSKPPNCSRVAATSSHPQQSPKQCKLVKGPKPLANHRFYLDIEKHNVSSRIELKIAELGGSIEFFLAKEVTHFVTDKASTHANLLIDHSRQQQPIGSPSPLVANNQQNPRTPKTPLTPYTPSYLCDSPNVSHAANESKDQAPKHRSRADAMLQRARLTQQQQQQTTNCDTNSSAKHAQALHSHSPVQLAKSWGTPIWTPEYTLRYLEKVAITLGLHNSNSASTLQRKSNVHCQVPPTARNSPGVRSSPRPPVVARPANTKRLRGEFIKIEACDRNYRPYYKEFKYWPTINLSSVPGFCPFAHEPVVVRTHPQTPPSPTQSPITMTRKSRNSKTNRSAAATTVAKVPAAAPAHSPTPPTPKSEAAAKCGYCEICHIEYDALATHLQSDEHQNFVKNSDNFLTLDSLISNSANVQSFLSANRTPADLDDGLFGKRTAGKKVGKLFRATDEIKRGTADDHHLATVGHRVNGSMSNGLSSPPKVLTMVTRRSNTRRTPDDGGGSERRKRQRRQTKSSRSITDDEDGVPDEPEADEDEQHMMVDDPKMVEGGVTSDSDSDPPTSRGGAATNDVFSVRARRESAKRINYAELREDEENLVGGVVVADVPKSKKIEKLRLRSIRWRPPSQEERSAMSQPFYKVIEETASGGGKQQMASTSSSRVPTTGIGADAGVRRTKEAPSETNASSTTATTATEPNTAGGSLKLRVCRVRESELSILTNEADKFMFPRISSEAATDEDRQSTSEPADISVDLPSSDTLDQQRMGRPSRNQHYTNNTPSDQSHQSMVTPRDLDASNKRKRRKQLEAFLNDNSEYYKFDNPESRLRFQEAPFQPTLLSHPADGPTGGSQQQNHFNRSSTATSSTTSHAHAASSSSELCSSGRGIAVGASLLMMCSSTATTSTSPWTSPSSRNAHGKKSQLHQLLSNPDGLRDTEDRKGASSGISSAQAPASTTATNANTYDKGHLLRTDVVKMHKFAFERVPSSEPWYEAFQRQDECRERVFEYWGSTAYRKLPFELGPLPPHSADCCPLAQMASTRRTSTRQTPKANTRTKRSKKSQRHKGDLSRPSSGASSPADEPPPKRQAAPVDPARELRIQKRLLKLQKHLELNALPGLHNTVTKTNSRTTTAASSKPVDSLETKLHKRKLTSHLTAERSRDSSADTIAGEASKHKPATTTTKQDTFLLDINGRPRKSPREHASTLAILSCLVQQRRKHEKMLNGGISPEKRAPVEGANHTDDDDDGSGAADDDEDFHTELDANHTDTERRAAPAAETEDENSINETTRRHIKDEACDSAETEEPIAAVDDDSQPSQKPDANAKEPAKPCAKPPLRPKAESTNTFPRMPISDYVNPHRVCREIDQLLSFDDATHHDDYDDVAMLSSDADDLVLISTPKDFLEIVTSVEDGPLRYRGVNLRLPTGLSSFGRRKRKNNRTGWPSVPRRRRASSPHAEQDPNDDDDGEETTTGSVSNATEVDAEEDSRTQRLQSTDERSVVASAGTAVSDAPFRGKFTEFTSVEGRASVVFTSNSDKAENSDIFTVSSDSADTADMTAVATVASSGIASGSQHSQPIDAMTLSNSPPPPALRAEDDESSSVDVTLAELMHTTTALPVQTTSSKINGIVKKHRRRSSCLKSKSGSPPRRVHTMQPVIRVKKMSARMLLATAAQRQRNRLLGAVESLPGHKTPPPMQPAAASSSSSTADQRVVTITGSGRKSISRQSCSPKAKFSPPKLRKPRGRWYRER